MQPLLCTLTNASDLAHSKAATSSVQLFLYVSHMLREGAQR
jgi:hypothetical protein